MGDAVARLMLARGWRVLGVARRAAAVEHEAYAHLSFDLSDTAALASELGDHIRKVLGSASWDRVALINNAALIGPLGWTDSLDPIEHARVYAVNVVAPTWLMGFFMEAVPSETTLRIVNVSSGAALRVLPGLGAYSMSKAALRMAGMMLGAELQAARGTGGRRDRRDTAIITYMPGVVETDMQRAARQQSPEKFPSQRTFQGFLESGRVVSPEVPAEEIVGFAESGLRPSHTEEKRDG